jgi:hypothetical protein
MVARIALSFVICIALLGDARAQAVLEGDPAAALPGAPVAVAETGSAAEWGLGVRLRNVRLPRSMLELFVDRAAGGGSDVGFGVDLVRRKGELEVQFGVEYERLSVDKGIWIEKDKPIPANEADFVEFNGFGWVTLDATFLYHTPFNKYVALRYGGGGGLGVLFGDVTHVDRGCTSSDPQSCTIETMNGQKVAYGLPPVMLVVNAVIGLQVRPIEKMTLNLEAGIRTLPFFGASGTYFF